MPFSSHSLVFACFNVASSAIIFRYYNAWQVSSLDGAERDGAQPSRQAAVVWRERSRGRVTWSGRPGPWPPPWTQGIAPLQPWRARAARRCGVPTRLRRVARRRAGPARPRIDYDQADDHDQDFVGVDEARDKDWRNFQLPKNNPVTFLTHTRTSRANNRRWTPHRPPDYNARHLNTYSSSTKLSRQSS